MESLVPLAVVVVVVVSECPAVCWVDEEEEDGSRLDLSFLMP